MRSEATKSSNITRRFAPRFRSHALRSLAYLRVPELQTTREVHYRLDYYSSPERADDFRHSGKPRPVQIIVPRNFVDEVKHYFASDEEKD